MLDPYYRLYGHEIIRGKKSTLVGLEPRPSRRGHPLSEVTEQRSQTGANLVWEQILFLGSEDARRT